MSKKFLLYGLTLGCLVAVLVPASAQGQTCEPLNNGRLADVFYEGTALFFEPVVEFRTMTLTIGGPCEDIVKVFGPKETISFDLREIERIVDGQYSWELHREATVDEGVQKDLQASRGTGEEDALWWSYFQKGAIPEGPYVDSGSFTVVRGEIIDPNSSSEEKSATLGEKDSRGGSSSAIQATLAGGLGSGESGEDSGGPVLATKDTVLTNNDGVIRNSLCVGFDCLNNNTYDDTTILLTENNTRIKFEDTSSANSFPRNDWEIEANSRQNGGANYLGFNDCGQSSGGGCADDLVFAVEAGVRQHALYVESDGDVGLGTNNPVVRLHVVDGDTPALRLEQDGSNGFAPHTWDVAGNETNFFVRDATSGSTLPFRIFPGNPSNTLMLRNANVGVGTSSPAAKLHVVNGNVRVSVGDVVVREDDDGNNAAVLTASNTRGTVELLASGGVTTALNRPGGISFMENNLGLAGCQDPDHDLIVGGTGAGCNTGTFSEIDAGESQFTTSSSRTIKENLRPVQADQILAKLQEVGVYTYDFINGASDRIGLMAEDFHQIFGRGSDKMLSGHEVQLALWLAVQELTSENTGLTQRIEELESLVLKLAESAAN